MERRERSISQRLSDLYKKVDSLRKEDEEQEDAGRREEDVQDAFADAATSTPAGQQPYYYLVRQDKTDTEEILKTFTQTMTGLLQRFVDVSKQPKVHSQVVEQYEGRVDEDPHRFIDIMQHYVNKLEYTTDIDRIAFFRGQLKGEARKWAETIKNAPISYQAFINRFLDEFNSPKRLAEAYKQLYAKAQGNAESAEEFISQKQSLLARLRPNMTLETTIEIIISLLKPALASRVIGARPATIEDLIKTVRRIEAEVEKEYTLMNNWRKEQQQPPAVTSPCRWCGQWHLSYTCSANPYKNKQPPVSQQKVTQQSGNAARALTSAREATTAAAGQGRQQQNTTNARSTNPPGPSNAGRSNNNMKN